MTFPQLINASASPEVQMNENFQTLKDLAVYGNDPTTTSGLVRGYYGGRWNTFATSDSTHTFGASTTTYVAVSRADGSLNFSTSSTNYNDATNYAKVETVVTGASAVTSVTSDRVGGIFAAGATGGGGGGGTELKGLTFTSDTSSTADSDPGNGKFKWNNATQSAATVLFFDNQTADGISLTTYYASLGPTGFMFLQQSDDATKWQLWKWTILPVDGSGYRKFTMTLQAGSAIADAKTVYVDFSPQVQQRVVLAIACSDETTALTAGTNKVKFINPYASAFNVTRAVASLSTAQASGSIFTVDINEAGTTILSTKLTIDNTETNSGTAATPAVISDASIAAYAEIEVDIDQVGDGTAKGLKIYLEGYPA